MKSSLTAVYISGRNLETFDTARVTTTTRQGTTSVVPMSAFFLKMSADFSPRGTALFKGVR